MSLWTSDDAARATGGRATTNWTATGVSIDTRTLAPGDLFVALSAARDGHEFVAQALEKGAAAALVSHIPEGLSENAPLLVVDDVQTALEGLGRFARARLQGKVLAITGSVGKTTTKEMARVAFSGQLDTQAAVASYNNHWGVPLTLARTPADTELLIVEIGMSHPGEIAPLSRMARPHVAIVTTVAAAHLEAFDGLEGIAAEKASIFDGLEPSGVAIYNADLPTTPILAAASGAHGLSFGESAGADLRILDISLADETTVVKARHKDYDMLYRLSAPGRHLALNAASIILAAEPLGLDPDVTAQEIARWQPPAGRGARETVTLDPVEARSLTLIDDAFNANPASMAAALDRIAAARPAPGGRRVAILTDMLELGPEAASLHRTLADHPGIDRLAQIHTAGPLMRSLHEALPADQRGHWAETAEELASEIRHLVHSGDIVLVKGSKSSKAALVVDAIRELGHRHRRPAAKAR